MRLIDAIDQYMADQEAETLTRPALPGLAPLADACNLAECGLLCESCPLAGWRGAGDGGMEH